MKQTNINKFLKEINKVETNKLFLWIAILILSVILISIIVKLIIPIMIILGVYVYIKYFRKGKT